MGTHTSTGSVKFAEKNCVHKSIYLTRKEAVEKCNELYDEYRVKRKPYKCPSCSKFHLATFR